MKRIWRTLVYGFRARVLGITPRGDCRVCGHAWHGNVLVGGAEHMVPKGYHVLIPSYRCKACTHNAFANCKNLARSFLLRDRNLLRRFDDGTEVVLWPKEEGVE